MDDVTTEPPEPLEPEYSCHPVDEIEPLADQINHEELVRFLEHLRKLMRWVWREGTATPNGGMIRAAILAWVIQPEMFNNPTQKRLAHMLGLKSKQSLNREVSSFRDTFGEFQNAFMKNPCARQNMAKAYKSNERNRRRRIRGNPSEAQNLVEGDQRPLHQRGV